MKKIFLLASVSIVLCILGVCAQNPGIKFTITPAAVHNFNNNILPFIVARLQSIHLPDVNEKGVHVQGLSINKLSLPSNAVIANFGNNNLVLGTSKFGVEIKAHIKKKILFIKLNSDITATCKESSVKADISFGYANGHPVVNVRDFRLDIKKLHVKMKGGLIAKIAQLIINVFHGPIQRLASKKISEEVKKKLGDGINKAILRIPNSVALHRTPISVAYNLVNMPKVTPGYLSLPVDGTFFITSQGKAAVPVAPATPMPDYDGALGGQIQVFLNQYLFNTGLYSAWKTGALKLEISTSILDPLAGFKLNVGWFKKYVPEVGQKYGDDCRIVLLVDARTAPNVKLTMNNFGIVFTLGVSVYVESGTQRINIIDSEVVVDVAARMDIQNWIFKPVLEGGQVRSVRIIRSGGLQVNEISLKESYNQVTRATVKRVDVSKAAFALPNSPDAVMAAVSFAVKEGYIQIAANPTFKLPPV